MFKNYFKTAFRNLVRNRNYTIINIAGLAIGISVCMMIFIIIQYHNSFDDFHKNKDRIYRVVTEYHHSGSNDVYNGKGVPFAFPNALKASFPQIEKVAPFFADHNDQVIVLKGNNETDKKFKENEGLFYTEPSFFEIFNFPLLSGSYESLKEPNNVLLSKETAGKYFGDWKNALGKTIKINNTDVVKVTGVLATIPANTDFQIKLAVSYGTGSTKDLLTSTNYDNTNGSFGCYILLAPDVSAVNLDKQLRAYSATVKSKDNKDLQTIQSLRNIHYDATTGDFSNKTISHNMINILWLIAAFILLIACVNFINLSTAQAVNRAKEVGVRKVLGSNRWQLQLQFIAETFLLVLASIIFALVIAWSTLPGIGLILELSLHISLASAFSIAIFLLIIMIVVTMLAGFYPSIVLSGFNPINALKSKLAAKANRSISLRRGLVIFQFIIAQTLIIGTLIIVKQMNFFSSQPLGFNKDAVVNIPLPTDSLSNSKLQYLKQQLQNVSGIQTVSFNSNTPVENNNDMWTTFNFNHAAKQVDFYSIIKMADNDYVPTYKLPLIAGRNIEASDTMKEFLVNEMMLKSLGITIPQNGLNKEIKFDDRMKGNIVGVLKNFNTGSFRDSLAPIMITSFKSNYNQASIKLSTKDVKPVMASIEKMWNVIYPDFVFEYKFLDDKIEGFYKQENQLAYLYKIFAAIAILLSCLGLYGLASFMAVQRIKEVGIRRVLGATASSIVYLFSKEFVLLITIAFAIATPIAWYFMNKWLQNFAYRIELSWWLFLVGGIASIVIALISVSFQAIKAAMANPVKSLRTE
ncbi:MAG TPA: ABC transporter permease [Parafilimonas sp.]|nr:ABC transporter permease [Parafilimonas sp.]